jgi:uncharacterized membrane protein/gas vesicle protein
MKQNAETKGFAKWMLSGAAIGALTMYLADPGSGRRRRAMAKDKMYKIRRSAAKSGDQLEVAFRDLRNRTQGLGAQAKSLLSSRNKQDDDPVVAARIREKLGRTVSHPRAIHVDVSNGFVRLTGSVPSQEKEVLLEAVRHVRGVQHVEEHLEISEQPSPLAESYEHPLTSALEHGWRPRTRAVIGTGASALSMYGLTRKTPTGKLLAAVGAALLGRAVINMPLHRLLGQDADDGAINIQKTLYIHAPVEQVFDLWSDYENFPKFMSRVKEVRDLGNGHSHWIVKGPAGTDVEWKAELTKYVQPKVIGWKSEADSMVSSSGEVHFEQQGNGTRVSVHMSYTPPAGVVGHAFASLLGRNAKQQLDEDLMRMKQFLENGIQPHDAAQRDTAMESPLH